jgi:hypothetical protein
MVGAGENVSVDEAVFAFREEGREALLGACEPFLGPVPSALSEFWAEPERIVHGGFKNSAGDGVVLVGQGAEPEASGFERDRAAAGHGVNDGDVFAE